MTLRRIVLRVLGLGVAAIVLVAATQLLLLGFEADPLLSRSRVDSFVRSIQDPVHPGPGILVGLALVGLAALLLGVIVASLRTDRPVLTTRRRGGWTKIDRKTLADALERRLEDVDRRSDLDLEVTRRGRVNVKIVTPDPAAAGPAQELRDAVDDEIERRGLPCRSGRITVNVPRRMTSRRRIR